MIFGECSKFQILIDFFQNREIKFRGSKVFKLFFNFFLLLILGPFFHDVQKSRKEQYFFYLLQQSSPTFSNISNQVPHFLKIKCI